MSQLNETVSPSLCGRKLSYPSEIDENLVKWVKQELANGVNLTPDVLRKEALKLIQPYCYEFKASSGWLDKFLSRHKITLLTSSMGKNSKQALTSPTPLPLKHVTSPIMENKTPENLNMQILMREDSFPRTTAEEHNSLISPRGSEYIVVELPKNDMVIQKPVKQPDTMLPKHPPTTLLPNLHQQYTHEPQAQQVQPSQSHSSLPNHLENGEEDEEEDDDDESELKKEVVSTSPQKPVNPERLKAFNMFVRLFIDENLDRLVPISKQPKEKINAIIMSCQRQFPEFSDRARKRIRTYLKSCRRSTKLREPTSRPSMSHIPATQLNEVNNILAKACHNESQEVAKRQRLESNSKPNEIYPTLDAASNKAVVKNLTNQNIGAAFPTANQNDTTIFQSFMTAGLKQPLLKLSQSEVTAVRNLIEGYRQSASFLTRSADELERLLKTCSAYVDDNDKNKNNEDDCQSSNSLQTTVTTETLEKTDEGILPNPIKEIISAKPKTASNVEIELSQSTKADTVNNHGASVISPTSSSGALGPTLAQKLTWPISTQSVTPNSQPELIGRTLEKEQNKTKKTPLLVVTNAETGEGQNNGLLTAVSAPQPASKQKDKIAVMEKSLEPLIKKIKAEKNIENRFLEEIPNKEALIEDMPAKENVVFASDVHTTPPSAPAASDQHAPNPFKQLSMEQRAEERHPHTDETLHSLPQHNEVEKYPDIFHGHMQQQFEEKGKRQHQTVQHHQQHLQEHQQPYSPKEHKQPIQHFDHELPYKSSRAIITSPPGLDHMHTQHFYSEQSSPSLHTVTSPLSQMQSYQASKHLQKLQNSYIADHLTPSSQHSTNVATMQRGNHASQNSQHLEGDQLPSHTDDFEDHSNHPSSYAHEYSTFPRQPQQQTARISPQMSQQQQINRTPHSANYHHATPSGHHQNVFNFDQQMLESSHQTYLHQRLSPHINSYHPLISPQELTRQSTHMQDISRQSQLQNVSRQPHIQEISRQQLMSDMNRQSQVQDMGRHSEYQFAHGLPFDMHSSH